MSAFVVVAAVAVAVWANFFRLNTKRILPTEIILILLIIIMISNVN